MNKKLLFKLIYIFITIILFFLGITLGIKIEKYKKNKIDTEKISISSIIISKKDLNSQMIVSSDLVINDNLLKTYEEIFNSKKIKKEIEKKYGKVNAIEIEQIDDTSVLKVIYVCNENEVECININNDYVLEFKKNIVNLYNVDVIIVDTADITVRKIENK